MAWIKSRTSARTLSCDELVGVHASAWCQAWRSIRPTCATSPDRRRLRTSMGPVTERLETRPRPEPRWPLNTGGAPRRRCVIAMTCE